MKEIFHHASSSYRKKSRDKRGNEERTYGQTSVFGTSF